MDNFNYVRARGAEEALDLAQGPGACYLAGGTDLLPLMKERIVPARTVVDISGWEGAGSIAEQEGGLRIGALATLSQIERDERVRTSYTALAEACGAAATPQLRNMSSIGGNLLQQTRCWYFRGHHNCWMKGGPWCYAREGENEYHSIFMTSREESKCVSAHPSDPGAALLALDATVVIATQEGEQQLPVSSFFALPTEERRSYTMLPEGALIVAIDLPRPAANSRSSYTKAMARATWAFALAGIALSLDIEGDQIGSARVALSGVAPIPFRHEKVEEELTGRSLNDLDGESLAGLLVANAAPLANNRYKVDLLKGLFKQALFDLTK